MEALATIARRDAADPWIRTAVLSSVADASDQLLVRLLADEKFTASPAGAEMIRQLAQIVGLRLKNDEIIARMVDEDRNSTVWIQFDEPWFLMIPVRMHAPKYLQ